MPIEWSDRILIGELADEPLLAEELSSIFERIKRSEPSLTPHVVLNFSAVTFLNSSHIAQILRVHKVLADLGRSLVLCSMRGSVWQVIQISGLDRLLRVVPDPMTALASLQIEDSA